MKKQEILSLLYTIASPAALIVLGVVLFFHPDTASVLIARVLGWCLTAVGVGFVLAALFRSQGRIGKVISAVVCLGLGSALAAQPLLLAAFVGRILGVLIALRGIRDVMLSRSRGHGQLLALVVTLVGIVLALLPMTASRLVFSVIGAVLFVLGIAMLIDRLKDHKHLPGGKQDIIDAL